METDSNTDGAGEPEIVRIAEAQVRFARWFLDLSDPDSQADHPPLSPDEAIEFRKHESAWRWAIEQRERLRNAIDQALRSAEELEWLEADIEVPDDGPTSDYWRASAVRLRARLNELERCMAHGKVLALYATRQKSQRRVAAVVWLMLEAAFSEAKANDEAPALRHVEMVGQYATEWVLDAVSPFFTGSAREALSRTLGHADIVYALTHDGPELAARQATAAIFGVSAQTIDRDLRAVGGRGKLRNEILPLIRDAR